MTDADSPQSLNGPALPRCESRDNNRVIPVSASAPPADMVSIAEAALDEAADAFLIHRALFDRPARSTGRLGQARQAAVAACVELGALGPWEASKAFRLDLSTVKHAVRKVPERAGADPAYGAAASTVQTRLAARLTRMRAPEAGAS